MNRRLVLKPAHESASELTISDDGTVTVCVLGNVANHETLESPPVPRHPRYHIEQRVGVGGMAEVWRAFDSELNRLVALKIARRDARPMIQSEGLLIASLQHPNTIPIYDIGETEDGQTFYVMKLLEGRTLEDVLQREEWTQSRLLDAMRQVCIAIHYAHDLGLVHRDIKPSNIIVGEYGEVFVSDWGIARDFRIPHDEPGVVRGTPSYLAPEQLIGDEQGGNPLTDVFALGCCLYRITVGHRPYPTSIEDVMRQFVTKDFIQVPRYLGELQHIITDAICPDPSQRTASAGALAQQIEHFLDSAHATKARHQRAMRYAEEARLSTLALDNLRVHGVDHSENPVERIIALNEQQVKEQEFQREFARATNLWTLVLREEPDNSMASQGLTRLYWDRALELETSGRFAESALLESLAIRTREDLVQSWDAPAQLELVGYGHARVETLEDYPIQRSAVVWEGEVPSSIRLPRGEYRVEFSFEHQKTMHVIRVSRGQHRKLQTRYATVPEGFRVIDQGQWWCAFQINPVTVQDYLEFVNLTGDDEHVPRLLDGRQYFIRTIGGWTIGEDADGDAWDPLWPALLVSHQDARAFVSWAQKWFPSARLPLENEWEFAARGESRRDYPWGTHFHPSFSVLRDSHPGIQSMPERVDVETADISPFGIRFMAGNICNWTDSTYSGRPVFKGAAYNSMAELARIESAGSAGPSERLGHCGLRLVLDLEWS